MTTNFLAVAAATLVLGMAIPAQAANNVTTPGHKMQTKGSLSGHPGASGYSPGHVMQQRGSKTGHPGASGYAPGNGTTTGAGRR
jgi:chitodextrinase